MVNNEALRLPRSGVTNLPYVLNPAAPASAAAASDNDRDNVGQVFIAQPTNATYLVRVTHKGNLQSNATQWVSILLSGNVAQPAPPLVINQIVKTATTQIEIGWPAVVGQTYQVQARNTLGTANWANVGGIISARLTNVVVQIPLNATDSQQFYRVVQQP
jgi:hypothetical protein